MYNPSQRIYAVCSLRGCRERTKFANQCRLCKKIFCEKHLFKSNHPCKGGNAVGSVLIKF